MSRNTATARASATGRGTPSSRGSGTRSVTTTPGTGGTTGGSDGGTAVAGTGTTTGLPTVSGYGQNALATLGTGTYVVSTTATGTTPGTIMAALAWLNAGNSGTISFSIDGTFVLPGQINMVTGAHDFLIDGRGHDVTLSYGNLWFEQCYNFGLVNFRHRGGWDGTGSSAGAQDADCITTRRCHDFFAKNLSLSGFYDEAFDIASHEYNVTLEDILIGPGGNAAHSFGSGTGCFSYHVTQNRVTFVGMEYRNPRVEYWSTDPFGTGNCINGDSYDGGTPPVNIVIDSVNPVRVDCDWGIAIYGRGLINDKNATNINTPATGSGGGLVDYSTGSQTTDLGLGTTAQPYHSVDPWASITPMTAAAAATYAKTHSGCLGADGATHDSFDTALLARIP